MARLKKADLLIKLKELNINFDESMKYNDLHKLYDNNKDKGVIEIVNEEPLNAVYKYKPEEGAQLITDKPSEPVYIKTDKQIYDNYLGSGKGFNISYKGEEVFNSSTFSNDKLKTHETNYEVHGRFYPYVGSSAKLNS